MLDNSPARTLTHEQQSLRLVVPEVGSNLTLIHFGNFLAVETQKFPAIVGAYLTAINCVEVSEFFVRGHGDATIAGRAEAIVAHV